jgi:DNA replication licensing factor MCM2
LGSSEADSEDAGVGALSGVLPAGVKVRMRRQYDERRDQDDAAGVEDDEEEIPFEHLADIKANSVAEWIAQPRVRKTIEKQFRDFLVTYTDGAGKSVYGERVKTLGESERLMPIASNDAKLTFWFNSEFGISGSLLCAFG